MIYCVAGLVSSSTTDAVYYASLSPTGVGTWKSTTSYPTATETAVQSCVAGPTFAIACVAGLNSTSGTTATYLAKFASPGLGSWFAAYAYPDDTGGLSCVVASGYMFCVGGSSGGSIASSVYFTSFSETTGLSEWVSTTSYPIPIEDQSCAVWSGFIYCVGGFTSGDLWSSSVYYAPISSAGIGAWASTTSYSFTVDFESCQTSAGYIYCVGGNTGSFGTGTTNAVYYAKVSSSGVGAWRSTSPYPLSNVEAQSCGFSSGYNYCVGGDQVGVGSVSSVYFSSALSTSTKVTCAPSSVGGGKPTTCTATVKDTGSATGTPTGKVKFTSNLPGTFSSSSCTLSGSGTSASCSVTFTPTSTGTCKVTGKYGGDSSHLSSKGHFTLSVT